MALDEAGTSDLHMGYGKNRVVDLNAKIIYNGDEKFMVDTHLAQSIRAANDSDSAYDTNVKCLLADKQILSWILKYTLIEFGDMEVSDIRDCIGDDIEIDTRPVDAGLSNLGRVQETVTEDNVPGEGIIYYDVRFTAYHKGMELKILVNVEGQKSSDSGKLGYHLENRIVFYLARMISAQKQMEFFHSDFDNLKRVRSIWICMDSKETGDSIEEISFESSMIFGDSGTRHHTDLMKGIIVNIRNGENIAPDTIKKSKNKLIAMLEELLSRKDVVCKNHILGSEYGMIMTRELEGRMQNMCNLSELVKESAIKNERIAAVERMLKADATKEQIISFGYTEEEIEKAEEAMYANV